VEFDTEGVNRRLLSRPDPDLTKEQLAKLPPKIELTLSFRLESSGIITSVSVLSGSGDTEVDTRIRQAVREWRFDRSEGAEPVEGTLRIILRTGG
jgi:TonB family protein